MRYLFRWRVSVAAQESDNGTSRVWLRYCALKRLNALRKFYAYRTAAHNQEGQRVLRALVVSTLLRQKQQGARLCQDLKRRASCAQV